jgi:hypothetical protein
LRALIKSRRVKVVLRMGKEDSSGSVPVYVDTREKVSNIGT